MSIRAACGAAVRTLLSIPILLAIGVASAFAQASIAGVVKDSSGSVLPGVTVEASSPALIEKTRTVVTNGAGVYKIVDLRPGTYSVAFTLVGFSTVKRDGIELVGSFVASVDADMQVGSIEETVTVSGESPIVDIQSVVQQRVLDKEAIDSLPTGRNATGLAVLVPGVNVSGGFAGQSQDVGGNLGDAMTQLTIHGGRTNDFRLQIDGLPTNGGEGSQWTAFVPNMASAQEVTVDTSGTSAENAVGGVRINLIPQSGGNTFKGTFFITGVNSSFESNNFTQDLKDRGLKTINGIKTIYDINPGGGGPIVKDRLWFYASARWNENDNYVGGMFYNLNAYKPNAFTYAPDTTRPAYAKGDYRDTDARLTWQVTPRNKIAAYYDNSSRCLCPQVSPTIAPESALDWSYPAQHLATLTWSAPVTNRLLFEAGAQNRGELWQSTPRSDTESNPAGNQIGVVEQSTGVLYRGWQNVGGASYHAYTPSHLTNVRASVSYVTGAHAFKVGFTDGYANRDNTIYCAPNSNCLVYRFNNQTPNQLTETAWPIHSVTRVPAEIGAFAQDKWTFNRLTLNLGVRFDYEHLYFPASTNGPSPLAPTRNVSFPDTEFLSWKDITPRLGLAYDVFGDGKTAVRVSLNKYVTSFGYQSTFGNSSNPAQLMANVVTRTWTDTTFSVGDPRRSNFVPDCDLLNPLANGECGTMSDTHFGSPTVTTTVDPTILAGWGKRGYNWEFATSLQRQLAPRVSAEVGYYRRWYGNQTVTQNRAVAPTDYSPYSFKAPLDPGLPGGGGYLVTDQFDLNSNKVGQVNNFLTFTDNFGGQIEHWNGFDASVAVRAWSGLMVQGGLSTGRTFTDNCQVAALALNPSQYNCRVTTNFLTQVKLIASYTIPKIDSQVSTTFQSLPGPAVLANYVVPAASIIGLGRPLSAGSPTVNLLQAGTMYGERLNQFDLRFGKIVRFNGIRTSLNVDLYNVFNRSAVQQQNNAFASWQVPQIIQQARFVKLSALFNF